MEQGKSTGSLTTATVFQRCSNIDRPEDKPLTSPNGKVYFWKKILKQQQAKKDNRFDLT